MKLLTRQNIPIYQSQCSFDHHGQYNRKQTLNKVEIFVTNRAPLIVAVQSESHKTNVSYCKSLDIWNQFIVGTDEEIVMVGLLVYCILIIFCACITGTQYNNATSISYNVKILNMNVWGIRYYADRKSERMKAIYRQGCSY